MPKPRGGRGLVAPYDTKLTRIPVPIADQVEELKERYQEFLDQGGEPLEPPLLYAIAEKLHQESKFEELQLTIQNKDKTLDDQHKQIGELLLQVGELLLQVGELKLEILQKQDELAARHQDIQRIDQGIMAELRETAKQRDELDAEVNQLHEKNGDLNLEIEILKQQLANAVKPVNKFELNEANANAEDNKVVNKLSVAVRLLEKAVTPKAKGGSYAANNATGLKKLVEQVLKLLMKEG